MNFQIGKSWESMNFAGNPLPAKGLRCDVIFLEKVGWVGLVFDVKSWATLFINMILAEMLDLEFFGGCQRMFFLSCDFEPNCWPSKRKKPLPKKGYFLNRFFSLLKWPQSISRLGYIYIYEYISYILITRYPLSQINVVSSSSKSQDPQRFCDLICQILL